MIKHTPLTPLQAMTQTADELVLLDTHNNTDEIVKIDPNLIKNWRFSDRPETEIGDIEALAKEFKDIGQQQPCVVRKTKDLAHPYEIIAGERRWRASQKAGIQLKVIIKNITDAEAAIIQASENSSRLNLSDYAKGMSYHNLIANNILSQSDLVTRLGKSKQYVSSILSFARIPVTLREKIKTMHKVSYRTAEEIARLSVKGPLYIEALSKIASQIGTGKYGQEKINKFVLNFVAGKTDIPKISKDKVYTRDGTLICTITRQDTFMKEILFTENISRAMAKHDTDLMETLVSMIEKIYKSAAADKNPR